MKSSPRGRQTTASASYVVLLITSGMTFNTEIVVEVMVA